jgi:hypothetical protein
MIWHLLAFAAGVQVGLDRLWNIVIGERRGGCGR